MQEKLSLELEKISKDFSSAVATLSMCLKQYWTVAYRHSMTLMNSGLFSENYAKPVSARLEASYTESKLSVSQPFPSVLSGIRAHINAIRSMQSSLSGFGSRFSVLPQCRSMRIPLIQGNSNIPFMPPSSVNELELLLSECERVINLFGKDSFVQSMLPPSGINIQEQNFIQLIQIRAKTLAFRDKFIAVCDDVACQSNLAHKAETSLQNAVETLGIEG